MRQPTRVGFIGLGYMGHGMALNLRDRGFPMTVMAHRKREAVDDLVRRGAVEVATPADMARQSEIIILCVTGSNEVDQLVRGSDGIAGSAEPGLVIVDCTTSDPSTLLSLAEDFVSKGIVFVDAPLGRSPAEAREGKLSTMVGCDATTLNRIRPILSAFATQIQHVGPLGNGHRLKLVNNLVSLGYAALYSEALVMARKAGLSTEAFDQLMRSSRMHCQFYDTFMGWALDGDDNRHPFALDVASHSIADVVEYAHKLGIKNSLGACVAEVYRKAVAAGIGASMLPQLPRSVAAENGIDLQPVRGARR